MTIKIDSYLVPSSDDFTIVYLVVITERVVEIESDPSAILQVNIRIIHRIVIAIEIVECIAFSTIGADISVIEDIVIHPTELNCLISCTACVYPAISYIIPIRTSRSLS